MENFVLYDEVGHGDHSVVYKGRRKGTINFVAIHCIDKCRRPEITNMVRLTHEIDHKNVVKFYEWYETTNHLWLVVELCTGGSLETIIAQDNHLPESAIGRFGVDLVQGLHHLHSLGIIFSDLKPSKILLDGPGILKYADFGISRVEEENLDELFQQFGEVAENWASRDDPNDKGIVNEKSDIPKKYRTLGSPTYMAPEVLQGGDHSISSDLWSFGCVLYEMYTGHPPFLADSFQQLVEKILQKTFPPPKVKGARVSGKPTPEFEDLVQSLLKKNPHERLGWGGLVTHPFWQGELHHLASDLETASELYQSVRQSIANFSARASTASELPKGNSVLGQIHGVSIQDDIPTDRGDAGPRDELGTTTDRPGSTMSMRPKSALGTAEGNVAFTISSRPSTANADPDDHLLVTSPQKLLTQSPLNTKQVIRKAKQQQDEVSEDKHDVYQLIHHTSDFTVTSIVDNPKIQKPASLKYESKSLQVPPYSVEKILAMQEKDQHKHLCCVAESIAAPEKGPPTQKRIQLLNYAATIGGTSQLANTLVSLGLLNTLAKQTKENAQIELRSKLCRVIGIIANNTTEVEESTQLSEVTTLLTEVIRDNFRNSKVKAAMLPALGEVLYVIATQEEIRSRPVEAWTVASMTYTIVIRCLRDGEEALVNHYAAKTIENIATTSGQHSQKFAVNEVGQLLWYVFTHASADTLRITALSAMSRLTKHSPGIFQNVMEKVGFPKMLSTMALPISRIQQAVITMFATLITSDARLNRLIHYKDFTHQIMRLLESPSVVIRGKAFLVLLEIIRSSQDLLLGCCQNRLVMYIERDSRRQAPGKAENQSQVEYIGKCLQLLINTLVDIVPNIMQEILAALEAVSGRKHPSTVQVKQLKTQLPMIPVLQYLVSSQVFRPRIVDEEFLKKLGLFLHHVRSIDSGLTQIQAATGSSGSEDFIHTVFAIVESTAQHPHILSDYQQIIIDRILPALAALVSSSFGETRALSLRLFCELTAHYVGQDQFDGGLPQPLMQKLNLLIAESLLPKYEEILLEQDPLPSYGLKLLLALLEQNAVFVKELERQNLIPVLFQVLMDHQSNPVGTTMQLLVSILDCLVTHKETNLRELYDQGLVDHVFRLFVEICDICLNTEDDTDLKGPSAMLFCLLDMLNAMLKYVSEVVRKALQAKKGGGNGNAREAEQAETLLLTNKPFTNLMSLLVELLGHAEQDIAEISLKCLSLLVQLFGGDQPEAMSPANMEHYSEALKRAEPKKQKVILRIIKRMISTEKVHVEMMQQHGGQLAETIRALVHTASCHAEVALSTLAAEILKATGYM